MSAVGGAKRRPMSEQQGDSTTTDKQSGGTGVGGGPLWVVLQRMDPRWRKWWTRGVFSGFMIGTFAVIVCLGPIALSLLVLAIFLKCFQEIISIGYNKYKEHHLPLYRVLNWYFLLVATYFLYGDNLYHYYPQYRGSSWEILSVIGHYHRITCFCLYVAGFVLFVLSLKKELYQTQFGMFGWTHLTMFMLGSQAYLIMQNVFEAPFWFLLPVSMVICNDIMAYMFGFFFGRTSLIKLSPNKTWEGFLGAFASTVVFGFICAHILASFDFFICYKSDCVRTYFFQKVPYQMFGVSFQAYPAIFHSLPLSIFASLIAPFGGFFASGFKRASNIKDFADLIPGHGGIMDRFDCQILMATFANVYYFTFCKSANPVQLLVSVLALPEDKQMELFESLKKHLNL